MSLYVWLCIFLVPTLQAMREPTQGSTTQYLMQPTQHPCTWSLATQETDEKENSCPQAAPRISSYTICVENALALKASYCLYALEYNSLMHKAAVGTEQGLLELDCGSLPTIAISQKLGPFAKPRSLAYSLDSLAAGYANGTCLCSRSNATIRLRQAGPVQALTWLGATAVVTADKGKSPVQRPVIYVWDIHTAQRLRRFSGPLNPVRCLTSISPVFLAGGKDKLIHMYDVRAPKIVETLMGHQGTIKRVEFYPDDPYKVAACTKNSFMLHDARYPYKPLSSYPALPDAPLADFSSTPDQKAYIIASESGALAYINIKTLQPTAILNHVHKTYHIRTVRCMNTQDILLLGHKDTDLIMLKDPLKTKISWERKQRQRARATPPQLFPEESHILPKTSYTDEISQYISAFVPLSVHMCEHQ